MRTVVVTGAASGIGAATAQACVARGWRAIGVDRAEGVEVRADLSLAEGRRAAVEAVSSQAGGRLDAAITCAGVASGPAQSIIGVNFFGAVELLTALRPLLARGDDPRAVAVSSEALILEPDEAVVAACLLGDEAAAAEAAASAAGQAAYSSSKQALSRWIKREAVGEEWAGEGILLNAVAPGVVATPLIERLLVTAEGMAYLNSTTPMRLGRPGRPEEIAELLLFLAGPPNSFIVGQTIFCDGGAEATLRPGHL